MAAAFRAAPARTSAPSPGAASSAADAPSRARATRARVKRKRRQPIRRHRCRRRPGTAAPAATATMPPAGAHVRHSEHVIPRRHHRAGARPVRRLVRPAAQPAPHGALERRIDALQPQQPVLEVPRQRSTGAPAASASIDRRAQPIQPLVGVRLRRPLVDQLGEIADVPERLRTADMPDKRRPLRLDVVDAGPARAARARSRRRRRASAARARR